MSGQGDTSGFNDLVNLSGATDVVQGAIDKWAGTNDVRSDALPVVDF